MRSWSARRYAFRLAFAFTATLLVIAAPAQEPARIPRIGVLMPHNAWQEEAFRSELRALGYEEGNNIAIEWRQSIEVAEIEGARKLVVDLLRTKIDLVVTAGTVASRAAMEASDKVPVVFAPVGDPVSSGLALSLAHPGKNGTGVSVVATELYPKRLEILHALAPRARRIGYLGNSSNPAGATLFGETVAGAAKLGLQLERIDVRKSSELDAALQRMQASKLDAVLVGGDLIFDIGFWKVADAVRKAKLPAIFPWREFHRYGVLLSYGPSMNEVGRQTARYVDRILKGGRPAEMPIEQISKYYLVIDMRVAGQMGVSVPQDLLLRADEVIR